MPTGDRREDKLVDIFLSAYDSCSWTDADVERPEKTQDNAVEAIARRRSDGKTLAIEHTITQPFTGEKRDLAQFWPAFRRLKNERSFYVPNRITRIFVPVGILDRRKPRARRAIADTVTSCLRASISSLPEGWSTLKCEIQNAGKLPLVVALNAQVLRTPNFTSFLIARQQVTADLDEVVEKALTKKLPKLVNTRADRRILMLEREHMNLVPKQIIGEIDKQRPNFPDLARVDEIWVAETVFFERDGAMSFFRYDAEGTATAEITYWDQQVRISWDQILATGQ